MRQTQRSKSKSLSNTNTRLGSTLPPFALLLVGLSLFSLSCSSGSGSPTEPSADPVSLNASASDNGVSGSSDSAEVDGAVTGVDAGSQTIFLATGDAVVVDSNTIWDPLGDIFSFSKLMSEFNAGGNVRVEADNSFTDSGAVLADTIKAETDDNGPNDDGPNDNDPDDDSDSGDDSDDSDSGDDSDDSDSGADGDDSDNSGQG
jgi:hypothetical protein